jgi:outer membrane protein
MKKLLLSALAVCAFTFSNAQETETTESNGGFAQGDMMISGSVGFTSTSMGDASANTFTIAPRAAYFVSDNIAVGLKLGYTSTKEDDGANDATENMMAIGAMARYYMTPASKFSVFAELGVNYMTMDQEDTLGYKSNGFGAVVGPGVSYFLSDAFVIEAGWGALGYSSMKADVDGADAANTFGLNIDMEDLTFGLAYKF